MWLRPFRLAEPAVADSAASDPWQLLYPKLIEYLTLLLRWNARTNLTAIRDPQEIVVRHFGESLFLGQQLRNRLSPGAAILDYGSGAGFPGLPIQLRYRDFRVTLAEAQGKKAAFLREAARTLGLETAVWARRVQDLPAELTFDAVTMRAVDTMEEAVDLARSRVRPGGWLAVLGAGTVRDGYAEILPIPGSHSRWLSLARP